MARTRSTSSGDLIADRRFALARGYAEDGDPAAAADLYAQALERAPGWAAGWLALGEVRLAAGDGAGAADAFRRALALDPEDAAGAGARLARLEGSTPANLPGAHIRALFDDYAPRFDRALNEGLGYRGPVLIHAVLDAALPGRRFAHALDLGCGTGLVGAAIAPLVDRLDGIDLSPGMLAEAARTGHYARLAEGEIVAHLRGLPDDCRDLVVAGDVLVYLGDLAPLFGEVARVLSRAGAFVFTVQAGEGADVALGPDLRYAHSAAYLTRLAADARLRLVRLDEASIRRERGRDVPGLLGLAAKP